MNIIKHLRHFIEISQQILNEVPEEIKKPTDPGELAKVDRANIQLELTEKLIRELHKSSTVIIYFNFILMGLTLAIAILAVIQIVHC